MPGAQVQVAIFSVLFGDPGQPDEWQLLLQRSNPSNSSGLWDSDIPACV
jgi:hypothetical protein